MFSKKLDINVNGADITRWLKTHYLTMNYEKV